MNWVGDWSGDCTERIRIRGSGFWGVEGTGGGGQEQEQDRVGYRLLRRTRVSNPRTIWGQLEDDRERESTSIHPFI